MMRHDSKEKDMLKGHEVDKVNADKIMNFLMANNVTIGLAESISAGGVTHRLTSIPGSSKVLRGAVACYTRLAKEKLLGVGTALLDEQGAVSEDVAVALAEGALKVFEADIGFGVTGNAGPSTDSDKSKVGQVHMALVTKDGEKRTKYFEMFGEREIIRGKSVTESLRMIREYLLDKFM
jgi:PncC family amidohydrolase